MPYLSHSPWLSLFVKHDPQVFSYRSTVPVVFFLHITWLSKAQTRPVLPALRVFCAGGGLKTRGQDYSSNVASFQRTPLRRGLCLVPCRRVKWSLF